ncbi:hypothetical protein G6F57_019597 [Rhizopus arrhizus]|nr:hypothetical protein G6F57_019597 [Rhizopus arrhizus]
MSPQHGKRQRREVAAYSKRPGGRRKTRSYRQHFGSAQAHALGAARRAGCERDLRSAVEQGRRLVWPPEARQPVGQGLGQLEAERMQYGLNRRRAHHGIHTRRVQRFSPLPGGKEQGQRHMHHARLQARQVMNDPVCAVVHQRRGDVRAMRREQLRAHIYASKQRFVIQRFPGGL